MNRRLNAEEVERLYQAAMERVAIKVKKEGAQRAADRQEASRWRDYLTSAKEHARGWGPTATNIRNRINSALDSGSLNDLRRAAAAYEHFRSGSDPRSKRRTLTPKVAPYLPKELPHGCGVRRQEAWGPKGGFLLNGGRVESRRKE